MTAPIQCWRKAVITVYVDPAASQVHAHKYTQIILHRGTHDAGSTIFIGEHGNDLNTHQQGIGLISK